MTSCQRGSVVKFASERGWRVPREFRVAMSMAALAVVFGAAPVATAFLQVPDDPSPESGTAQVVAQGVVNMPDGDVRWQVTERSAPPPANATSSANDLGFLIVDEGVLLIEDDRSEEQQRLPAGEAVLTRAGSNSVRAALGSDDAFYRVLALVEATEAAPADGAVVFSGEPFAGPGGRHDLDLVQDALGAGASMTIPGGALPTLVFLLEGGADISTEAGDVFSLGSGEAISLSGALTVTATENGAGVAAVYTGPAVPRLGQVAGTPAAAARVIASPRAASTPTASSSPAAADRTTTPDLDEDEDGLTASQEAELNTDPALADTDEDGLTDGQEELEFNTAPLAPDTDGDGVLDGDEVAQGTDPLDGIVAAPTAVEPPVDEESPPVDDPGTPGDSDGDGLDDALEAELGTDPFDPDTDDDGATDGNEYYVSQTGTRNPDTDGDGVLDGAEIANGTDPNDPTSS